MKASYQVALDLSREIRKIHDVADVYIPQLRPIRRVIDARCDHRRGLHQVLRRHVIIDIHVGVVRYPAVFHLILNELKSRQANLVERLVIRDAGIANRDGSHAEIAKRRQPCFKHRPHGIVI
jgi:hypothetical protein